MIKKIKYKSYFLLFLIIALLVIVIGGVNRLMQQGDEVVASVVKNTEEGLIVDIQKIRELEENCNKKFIGEVKSSDGEILWSKNFIGFEDTFSLVGTLRQGEQISLNTITSKYSKDLLADFSNYSYSKGGIKSLYNTASDIQLTLNHKWNQKIHKYMKKNNIKGSALTIDADTGAVLVSVSLPSTKPAISIDLEKIEEGSLVNKNLSTTMPGSTMKIVTTSLLCEKLGDKVSELSCECNGSYVIPENKVKITCGTKKGYKDLALSIGNSCNTFFAKQITEQLDKESAKAKMNLQKIGFTVGKETQYTNLGKLSRAVSKTQYIGDSSFGSTWSLIGETMVLVSPIDMTRMVSAVFNKGVGKEPYLVQEILEGDGTMEPSTVKKVKLFNKNTAELTKKYWIEGYQKCYKDRGYDQRIIAAKTGTAEVVEENKKQDNALLMGYAKLKKKNIAFFINTEGIETSDILPVDVANYMIEVMDK